MYSPLEQFKVNILWKLQSSMDVCDLIMTNVFWCAMITLFMVFVFAMWPLFYSLAIYDNVLYVIEHLYKVLVGFFSNMMSSYSLRYFPFFIVMFVFIFTSNFMGLLPFAFTVTSQLYITFACSISMFMGITMMGLVLNNLNFFKFFVPRNVANKPLSFFLVLIEMLSYIMSPFSLGIRLFANMLAGHTLLYILANFTYSLACKFLYFAVVVPSIFIFAIILLEFSIALIQTYVFLILMMLYMNDMFLMTH